MFYSTNACLRVWRIRSSAILLRLFRSAAGLALRTGFTSARAKGIRRVCHCRSETRASARSGEFANPGVTNSRANESTATHPTARGGPARKNPHRASRRGNGDWRVIGFAHSILISSGPESAERGNRELHLVGVSARKKADIVGQALRLPTGVGESKILLQAVLEADLVRPIF
jgi:hypothetical protein